jgi:hypothetical protein
MIAGRSAVRAAAGGAPRPQCPRRPLVRPCLVYLCLWHNYKLFVAPHASGMPSRSSFDASKALCLVIVDNYRYSIHGARF